MNKTIQQLQEWIEQMAALKATVEGCFDAANAEGLADALAETTDERLKDLVERRLMYALFAAQSVGARQPAQPQEPMTRYCPECGHIGDVPSTARDCCPDGMHARVVPLAFAHKCKETFDRAIAGNIAGGFAKLFWREDVGQLLVLRHEIDDCINVIFEPPGVGRRETSLGFADADAMGRAFAALDESTVFVFFGKTIDRALNLLDEIDLDDDGHDDATRCPRCDGDGADPLSDFALPCPLCLGEAQL